MIEKSKMRFGTKMVIVSIGGMISYTLLLFFLALLNIANGTDIQMPTEWNDHVFQFLTVEIVSLAVLRLPEKVKSKYLKDEGEDDEQID